MATHDEGGHSTAEYCVGTIGVFSLAFWLSRLAGYLGDPGSSWFGAFIKRTFDNLFTGDWMWRWLL